MNIQAIKSLFLNNKETALYGRYITNKDIEPLLNNLPETASVKVIGRSVQDRPIYGVKTGHGKKRVLLWSQMHGNESTTTKALFDLLNTLLKDESDLNHLLKACTLYIIPILNPDGAKAYTRINANEVDLNRDAQNLTQPESQVLRVIFNDFKPHFCYNLHGQRTIFSAGKVNKSATVSFLSPAQDKNCTITPNRKVSMEVIAVMNAMLQQEIPDQVGVYDDAFNINCVGDTFQSENVPTILFEAGHFHEDYQREKTRELIYMSYLTSLDYIAKNSVDGSAYEPYLNIPENEKLFLDIIIRNATVKGEVVDVGIQFEERLIGENLKFIPKIVKIEQLEGIFGHKEIEAHGNEVFNAQGNALEMDSENVLVRIDNEKILLNTK
ncbi:M14 family zinc carboxypeptidase [Pseudotamlana carrageenivorans]|uniref:Peptidase M14 n=1 Tax=Pseudotamlana carrageenivorans TaxID=2069432 RepID=A0A2I7SL75_9FLAO|nr:M14 family zinc carboxypeptidase [Tamlana carrageenivorans]AUS06675.1 peptidase M14 [Tamlana carrageenivorans]